MTGNQVEKRLTVEWMKDNFPEGGYWLNFPLGSITPGLELTGASYSARRRADALAVTKVDLQVIEMKIWKPLDGIDKLPVYKALVPVTPELRAYRSLPIRMILVTPRATAQVMDSAKVMDIEVATVSGGWIDEVVNHIEWLWSAEGRTSMAERARQRKWLGLE
jgi:hypothetical protein